MIIKSIELRDFRGISTLNLPIDENLTVIVGKNGVGKTSVLDAISYLLMSLRNLWVDESRSGFQPGIVRFKATDVALGKSRLRVQAVVSIGDENGGLIDNPIEITHDKKISMSGQTLHRLGTEEFTPSEHPLFVYYRQNRGFDLDSRSHDPNVLTEFSVRDQSLTEDLSAISDLADWWDTRDAEEARRVRDSDREFRDPHLEAVRKLVVEVDEFEGIGYEATLSPPGLYFQKTPNKKVHVSQLSSGERVYLVLLADLARRLQIIQPGASLDEIPGIVLIDEVELHLHPEWQRQIISTLTKVFKRCQFIVTTHSPHLLGEMKSDSIRILKTTRDHEVKNYAYHKETFGRDSNEILVGVLGATERNKATKENLRKLDTLIGNAELEQARELLDNLKLEIGGDLVELDIAEQRLRRREGIRQN